ncbi:hypothetical protein BN1263460033 [Stenotrophomonas indicatrix]|nr:hypothetical protein BN1263460033 [Stenotrophomonas indicatrix]
MVAAVAAALLAAVVLWPLRQHGRRSFVLGVWHWAWPVPACTCWSAIPAPHRCSLRLRSPRCVTV